MLGDESGERTLGGLPVKSNQRSDQNAQTAIGAKRRQMVGVGDPGFDEDALELGDVLCSQRFVEAQFLDCAVIHVVVEEMPHFEAETAHVRPNSRAGQGDVISRPNLVFEIRVDVRPLLDLDQLDQRPQTAPQGFRGSGQ